MNDWNGAGHMGGMWFFWIVSIVLIIVFIWAVFRKFIQTTNNGEESAEQLLKRRFANGEIEKDIYEKRSRDLRQ